MGTPAERTHYIGTRQQSRNKALAKQQAKTSLNIARLEQFLAKELIAGKTPEEIAGKDGNVAFEGFVSNHHSFFSLSFIQFDECMIDSNLL